MSNPFVAEIRMFAGNFAPKGWALCDGRLLSISQNPALFSLLGTTYGGNGTSNFALPDLRGRAPMQAGQGPGLTLRDLGETGGEQAVTLLQTELPPHSHQALASVSPASKTDPANGAWGAGPRRENLYANQSAGAFQPMNPSAVGVAGGDQPHNNMPPYVGLTFIIALQGVFPARS